MVGHLPILCNTFFGMTMHTQLLDLVQDLPLTVFSTTKSLQDVSWVDHVYATTIPTQNSKCSSQGSYHNGTSMTNSVPDISGFDNADATTAFVQGSTASTSGVTVCLDDLENTLMDYSHPTSSVDAGLDSRFPLLNV